MPLQVPSSYHDPVAGDSPASFAPLSTRRSAQSSACRNLGGNRYHRRRFSRIRCLLRCVWRIIVIAVRQSRWAGVCGFLSLALLAALSRRVRRWIWRTDADLGYEIKKLEETTSYWTLTVIDQGLMMLQGTQSWQELKGRTRLVGSHVYRLAIRLLSSKEAVDVWLDVQVSLLRFCHASWLVTVNVLILLFHVSRLLAHFAAAAFPYVAPPAVYLAEEFSQLSSHVQAVLVAVVLVYSAVVTLWYYGVFAKVSESLAVMHRTAASAVGSVLPYAVTLVVVYAPLKYIMHPLAFRAVFQDIYFGAALTFGLLLCLKLLRTPGVTRPIDRGDESQELHDECSQPRETPRAMGWMKNYFGIQELNFKTPRLKISADAASVSPKKLGRSPLPGAAARFGSAQLPVSVHCWLSFWVVMTVGQAATYWPERLVEWSLDERMSFFNIWALGSKSPKVKMLFSSGDARALAEGPTPGIVSTTLLTIQELAMISILLAAFARDSSFLRHARSGSIAVMEWAGANLIGVKFDLRGSTTRYDPAISGDLTRRSVGSPPQSRSQPANGSRFFTGIKRLYSGWIANSQLVIAYLHIERIGDAVLRLSPLVLLILPRLFLMPVLLIAALVIPVVAAIKALEGGSFCRSACWLLYFSGLTAAVFLLDLVGTWFPFLSGVRGAYAASLFLLWWSADPHFVASWIVRLGRRAGHAALTRAAVKTASTKQRMPASAPVVPEWLPAQPVDDNELGDSSGSRSATQQSRTGSDELLTNPRRGNDTEPSFEMDPPCPRNFHVPSDDEEDTEVFQQEMAKPYIEPEHSELVDSYPKEAQETTPEERAAGQQFTRPRKEQRR